MKLFWWFMAVSPMTPVLFRDCRLMLLLCLTLQERPTVRPTVRPADRPIDRLISRPASRSADPRLVGPISAALHNAGSRAIGPYNQSCLTALLNVQPRTNVCSISLALALPRNATGIASQRNWTCLTLPRSTSRRNLDYLTLPRDATQITSHYLAIPRDTAEITSHYLATQLGLPHIFSD